MYVYRATVTKVVDADTVHATLDLGCDVHIALTLRLAGIDAPELSTDAGKAARTALVAMLPSDGAVIVQTVKDRREKYGRYLATVYLDGDDTSLNAQLVAAGHARPYDGGPR